MVTVNGQLQNMPGVKDNNTTPTTVQQNAAPTTTPPKSDRRSNKPIMEKRRRARINNCLNELKTLILDAAKKDPSRHAKLEKADILEKTVKHLQDLQRQQQVMAQVLDPKIVNKFKAGFVECANEVSRFPEIDAATKRRLLMHLNRVHNGFKEEYLRQSHQTTQQPQHQHVLPSPPSSPEQDHHMTSGHHHHIQQTVSGYVLPNGLQVIPTKLANGQIALVLPSHIAQQAPALVPIPSRTASTGSASSHSSSGYDAPMHYAPPSPAGSYEGMEMKQSVIQQHPAAAAAAAHHYQQQKYYHHQQLQHHHQSQQPISLVVKKERAQEEEQPWRPW